MKLKIGIVGCGAVGSFYGARLCRSGNDVHFLLRSDYEVVRRQGVTVRSVEGNFHVRPACAKTAAEIGSCDLVLIGLKTTANEQFPHLIPPLVGPKTAVITLQNGLGNEEALAAVVGAERVLGGLCFVCLNRVAPGLIEHTAHGDILLGEFRRPVQERTRQYAAMFQSTGLRCDLRDNLEKAHWEKLLWNIPFNGLGVAGAAGYEAVMRGRMHSNLPVVGPCLPTDALLTNREWLALVRELMGEVLAAARRLGFEIPDTAIEDRIERTRRMGAYRASTLIDFERGQPLELNSLFLEPLRCARAAGVAMPRLAALCDLLIELDRVKKVAVG